MTTTTTLCSGCARPIQLDIATGEASIQGFATSGLFIDSDSGLLTWDCPACDYADSYEAD